MSDILRRATLRHLLHHPWQALLSIVGIALGVAVVLAIDLAGDSARRAFELSTTAVTGRATHHLVGGATGLDEGLYVRLRLQPGGPRLAPVVEEWVELADTDGRVLHLLGIDPFAEAPMRPYLLSGSEPLADIRRLLSMPSAAIVARSTAERLGLRPGDDIPVRISGRLRRLRLIGLLDPLDGFSREALDSLLLTDIATAQEILDRPGRLSRIDLILADGDSGDELRSQLPIGVELIRSASRSESAEQMTRAFRLNLKALSLLAVLCGAFLVFNTMSFAVVQRRPLIGRLRALGVTRRRIFALVLEESLLIGLLGSTLGLALGALLGRGLVERVTQTINDLYFVVSVRTVTISTESLAMSLGIGLGATLLAALAPAWEATTAPPCTVLSRADLETGRRRSAPRAAAWGLMLLAGGAALLRFTGNDLVGSFAGLFVVLVGCALLTPLATVGVAAAVRPLLGRIGGLSGRMAARDVTAHLSRTGVAIAALMMAVAVTVGVTLMVDSFRTTVRRWLELSLPADVYISAAGSTVRQLRDSGVGLDPQLIDRLRQLPDVAEMNTLRRVELTGDADSTLVVALDLDRRSHSAFDFKKGDPASLWPDFHAGRAVIISEPFAYHRGLAVGSRLTLPGSGRSFEVAGIFYDYASDRGVVILDRGLYAREWRDPEISAISLYVRPGADVDRVIDRIRGLGGEQRLDVRSERALREESMEVFERTFRITAVLRLLATLVAFIGVLSALMALQLERRREFGVLRALGMTPRHLWGLVTTQTGLIGLVAGLLAVPVGILMAAMMIFVINRRSFGWTMPLEVAPGTLLQAVLLATGAALLAGIYPAIRLARSPATEALREE